VESIVSLYVVPEWIRGFTLKRLPSAQAGPIQMPFFLGQKSKFRCRVKIYLSHAWFRRWAEYLFLVNYYLFCFVIYTVFGTSRRGDFYDCRFAFNLGFI
jgi:hypothetical protein